ncbi:MFS general substrate transporter [Marasmius fiardii PR-910]|nr:MFS general substrate transporter [Marasmius fiardii PR-910]
MTRNSLTEHEEFRPLLPDHEEGEEEINTRQDLERRLLRKVDTRMSILIVIYILNYIDRNNASAARLHGFEEDLGLHGSQFASILSILYVGYIIMQIPSNIFMNVMGKPSIYLPACMILWGALSISTGFCTSFFQALLSRFCLGFVEAAFFPGALFLLSKWYKRNELSQRTAYLSIGSLISNATGSLIASGILGTTDGLLGYNAWRWLFFIEGGLTAVMAFFAWLILPDFPETSKWLTEEERALAIKRMTEDTGTHDRRAQRYGASGWSGGFSLAVTDWKVWWLAATLTCFVVSLSFNAYFPTLIKSLGYDSVITLLLCVPPWLVAAIVAVILSRHSDKVEERCTHITLAFGIGIVGYFLAMSKDMTVRYTSFFLMAQSYSGFIIFLAWESGSVSQPPEKGAVAIALINTVATTGNIFGAYAWPPSWGPDYTISCVICAASTTLGIIMCWWFRQQLKTLNEGEMDGRFRFML